MITTKHYKAIAGIIEQVPSFRTTREDMSEIRACSRIAHELADYFEQDNPRFDRDQFMKACGLD